MTRKVGDLDVISFYKYEELQKILRYKYEKFGDKILKDISKLSLKEFFKNLDLSRCAVVPIDDNPTDFSHTAILAKECKRRGIKVLYNRLKASSFVKYAGKDLKFRQSNPKEFVLTKEIAEDVILVDDIITTGTTLLEAKKVLEKNSVHTLFAVTLAYS